MTSASAQSDVIDFELEEESDPASEQRGGEKAWKVLVVDDDADVQLATSYLLARERIFDRALKLIPASSAAEAMEVMTQHPDSAVILLDVVMEEHDSGLKFARWLRAAGFENVRVILRTGQSGYVQELEIIRDYDINDFRAKSELDRTRMMSSLTAALRAFEQIAQLDRLAYIDEETGAPNRNRLLKDIACAEAGTPLMLVRVMDYFAELAAHGRSAAAALVGRAASRLTAKGVVAVYRYSDDVIAVLGGEADPQAVLDLLRDPQNGGESAYAIGLASCSAVTRPVDICTKAESNQVPVQADLRSLAGG